MAAPNLFSILYLSFRMAPFILVSFFVLSAVLNQDIRGIIYLGGLLISCFIGVMIDRTFVSKDLGGTQSNAQQQDNDICDVITAGDGGRISRLPLSSVIFAFTTGYFSYPIMKQKSAILNIPTLIIFPLLCILDGFWNVMYGCVVPGNTFKSVLIVLVGAIGVGFSIGIGWSALLYSKNRPGLLYTNGISSKQTCELSSRRMVCSVQPKNAGASTGG